MKKIEYLTHTADIKIRLQASSVDDLFKGGLEGMGNILKKGVCAGPEKLTAKEKINLTSIDYTTLLVEFLSEVLMLSHVRKAIFCTLYIQSLTEHEIIGMVEGIEVEDFDEDIKAVTYHEADVKVNERGEWETIIVFDI